MAKPGRSGIARIVAALGYSLQGLKAIWRMEAAFRQEVAMSVVLIPLGFYLGEGGVEKTLLVCSCLLVMVVEVLNSAVEAVVDRVGHEKHELSGVAKDLGSLAVLFSLIMLTVTWVLILLF